MAKSVVRRGRPKGSGALGAKKRSRNITIRLNAEEYDQLALQIDWLQRNSERKVTMAQWVRDVALAGVLQLKLPFPGGGAR